MSFVQRCAAFTCFGAVLGLVACGDAGGGSREAQARKLPRFVYLQGTADSDRVVYKTGAITESTQFYALDDRVAHDGGPVIAAEFAAAQDAKHVLVQLTESVQSGEVERWVEIIDLSLTRLFLAKDADIALAADQVCDGAALALTSFEVQEFLQSEIAFGALEDGAVAVVHPGSSGRPAAEAAGWRAEGGFYVTLRERLEFDVIDTRGRTKPAYGRTRQDVIYTVIYAPKGTGYQVTGCETQPQVQAPTPVATRVMGVSGAGYLTVDGSVPAPEVANFVSDLGPRVVAVAGPYAIPGR